LTGITVTIAFMMFCYTACVDCLQVTLDVFTMDCWLLMTSLRRRLLSRRWEYPQVG